MTGDSTHRAGWLIAAVAVVAATAFVVVAATRSGVQPAADPVAVTVPVALSESKAPAGLKIGLVLTLGQDAEGAEWASAAQGAEVAKYRLGLGGTKISYIVEDDHGTAAGANDAVATLAKADVSGIVVASSGSHIDSAVSAAAKAGIPTVLPYSPLPEGAPMGTWSLAPTNAAVVAAMNNSIDQFSHTILLNAGGGAPAGLRTAETMQPQDSDLNALAAAAASRTGADPAANGAYAGGATSTPAAADAPSVKADALVVAGSPARIAELVAALQARQVTVPILLAPAAASSTFAQTLSEKGGTVSSQLRTFGTSAGDSTALGRDNDARAMSAFLQALGQLAGDGNATNLTKDAAFAQVAPGADARAHDAVLAFVHAAALAGSDDPARIRDRLSDVQVGAGNGIAGAPLDFSTSTLNNAPVQMMYATGQSLGLRPVAKDASTLSWFPEPGHKG